MILIHFFTGFLRTYNSACSLFALRGYSHVVGVAHPCAVPVESLSGTCSGGAVCRPVPDSGPSGHVAAFTFAGQYCWYADAFIADCVPRVATEMGESRFTLVTG